MAFRGDPDARSVPGAGLALQGRRRRRSRGGPIRDHGGPRRVAPLRLLPDRQQFAQGEPGRSLDRLAGQDRIPWPMDGLLPREDFGVRRPRGAPASQAYLERLAGTAAERRPESRGGVRHATLGLGPGVPRAAEFQVCREADATAAFRGKAKLVHRAGRHERRRLQGRPLREKTCISSISPR